MEFKYDILAEYGSLSKGQVGNKQLNLISYNKREPKFDLRGWLESQTMGKGITLTIGEALELRDILNSIDFNNLPKLY